MLSPAAEAISIRPSHPISIREAGAPIAGERSDDWRLVRAERVNALIVGPAGLVDSVLAQELPPGGCVAIGWSETDDLEITDVSPVIVIREVHELNASRQQRLLDWLARHPTLQVISTATSPVHPLVLDGRFLAELYYRLNVFSFFLQD
jgi:hypothetical protein